MNWLDYFTLSASLLASGLSIYFGFLPVRDLPASFFSRGCLIAAALWLFVGFNAFTGRFYYFGFALGCMGAAWYFRSGIPLTAKLWLSLAAALGATFGVLAHARVHLIHPVWIPTDLQPWVLASIYFGGALITVSYMGLALALETEGQARLRRAVEIILMVVGLRFLLLLASGIFFPVIDPGWGGPFITALLDLNQKGTLLLLRIAMGLVLPAVLALLAWKFAKKDMRREACGVLAALAVSVTLGESLALCLRF